MARVQHVLIDDAVGAGLLLRVPISPKMLAAGRRAFRENRAQLDDLYNYYPEDLDDLLREVYRKMARAA